MIKLNKKGITSIEILVCFTLVAIIAISMFNVIMKYKTKERIESIRENVISYKNNVTKAIQTDLIVNHLERVTSITNTDSSGTIKTTITLLFSNPFVGTSRTKTLTIYRANDKTNSSNIIDYISYQELNPAKTGLQTVFYKLDDYGTHTESISNATVNKRNLRFSSVIARNTDYSYFYLDIAIYHPELSTKEHITIKAPTDYQET